MHPSQYRKRASAGFTLIELAVVVVLLGILTALAAPNMTAFVRGTMVDRALDELMGDIAYTRMLAIRSGQSARLTVQPNGMAYVIETTASDGSTQVAKRVDLPRDFRGVSLAPAPTVLSFNSRGLRASSGGDVTIFAQQGTSRASLTVLLSGRASRAY